MPPPKNCQKGSAWVRTTRWLKTFTTAGAARLTMGEKLIFMVAKSEGGARFGSARPGTGPPRLWVVCASDPLCGEQAARSTRGSSKRREKRIVESRLPSASINRKFSAQSWPIRA